MVEEAGMVGGQPFAVNRSRQGLARGGLAASGRPYLPTYIECTRRSEGPHRLSRDSQKRSHNFSLSEGTYFE